MALFNAASADEARDKILAELNELDPPKEVRIDPTVAGTLKISDGPAIVGQRFELTLTATNKGKIKVAVPINRKTARDEWVWDGIGIQCSPDAAIQRRSIFTNPATVDYILPGETKTFKLTWTLLDHHSGIGELSLSLPPEFESVAPVKVIVNAQEGETAPEPQEGEQYGTGQPATGLESKSEASDKPQPEAEGRSR
jgi:hypothetical protein